MLFYICLGLGIILIIFLIIAVIIAIKEKDASFVPICLVAPFLGILLISGSFNLINRTGTVWYPGNLCSYLYRRFQRPHHSASVL